MIIRFCALGIIVAAILIAVGTLLPEEAQRKIKTLFLSDEQKVLFAQCESVRKRMREQKLPTIFQSVDFQIRNARLEKDPLLKDLKKCFQVSKVSPIKLEIEIFSSDFETQSSSDLQVQISVFNVKSSNKISEIGFRMDHEPYNQPAPSKNNKIAF